MTPAAILAALLSLYPQQSGRCYGPAHEQLATHQQQYQAQTNKYPKFHAL